MQDLTTRAQRMKRIEPSKFSDFIVPLVQALIALPFIYLTIVAYSLILK